MKFVKRTLGLFIALCIIVSNIPVVSFAASYFTTTPTGYTCADDVEYVTNGGYTANWGARGEVATFLSPYALEFYTGNYTFEKLSAYEGGTYEANVPDSDLYYQLYKLMSSKHSYVTSYDATKNLYKYTDCVSSNYSEISSFYSGTVLNSSWDGGSTWNREHTWPNSKGDAAGSGENDIMMLRPASVKENSSRGNTAYGQSSGYYDPNGEGANLRGDCARIVLYQFVRWQCTNTGSSYNPNGIFGTNGVMESLSVLLDWIEADPVDTWEMGRNDAVESITGTRNVFVDYPELAFLLFGDEIPADMTTPSGNGNSSCDHSYKATVTSPTCTEQGYTTYVCTLCSRTYQDNYTNALGHSLSVTSTTEATCTDNGSKTSLCSRCNQSFTETIAALGHDYVVDKVVDSTETEQGYTIYICTRCDSTYRSDYTSVVGSAVFEFGENGSASHSDGSSIGSSKEYTVDGVVLSITDASSVYAGGRDATGKSALKIGTGSNVGTFSFTVPDGINKVIILAAKYKANTSILNVNGVSYTLTTSSNDGEYTSIEVDTTQTKTVTVSTSSSGKRAMIDSISFVSGCVHAYDNSCDSSCNLCGAIRSVSHSYSVSSKTDATCTVSGSVIYICSVCSDSYTETVDATGHNYEETVVDPTQTEQGYTQHTCVNCGDSYRDSYTDPIPSTPDGDGVVFEFGENGDAAHKDGTELNAGAEYTSGESTLTIDSATKTYGGAFDAKGNSALKIGSSGSAGSFSFTVPSNVVKVIFKVAGYKLTAAKININGTAYTVSTYSSNGEYTSYEVDTSSSKTVSFATASGGLRAMIDSITYIYEEVKCTHEYDNACDTDCNLCGEERETSHAYDNGVVTAPTATAQGYTTYTCVNCGDSYKDNFTDPTGEAVNAYNVVATPSDTGIVVTWDAVEGADKYNFYLKNSAGETLVTRSLAADKTGITLAWPTDVEWGETYQIGIRPHTTKWLDTVYVESALVLGNRVVDVKTQSVGRTIEVTWQAYEGATAYRVYVYEKGAYPTAFTNVKVTTNKATLINAIYAEVDYEVRVVATVNGSQMKTIDAIPVAARLNVFSPDAFIERGITPTAVGIAWDQIRGVDKVWVYLNRVDGTGSEIIREAKGSIVGIYNLTPNTEYTVQIQARIVDADGVAHYSGKSEVLGSIKTSVWEDIEFKANGTESGAELTWKAHTNALRYYIYRSTDGGKSFKKIATVEDPAAVSYTDAAAKNGYVYAIQVQVKDDYVAAKGSLIKSEAIVK